MCGIFCIIPRGEKLSEEEKACQQLAEQSTCLALRGPDNTTRVDRENFTCIFYRLSINDISESGNQPMISTRTGREIILMANGEIYNHKILRQRYNLLCQSSSDCEVILRMYEKFGICKTVQELHGVFAIVIIDGGRVFLARDRLGVRPLYIRKLGQFGQYLAVASVPNALMAGDLATGQDSDKVSIDPVLPGTIQVYTEGKISLGGKIYDFSLTIPPSSELYPVDECLSRLKTSLIQAVKMRLLTDRPIGCLLSGGLDSSLIVSILARNLGGKNVRTYSIGMEESTDLVFARKVAEFLETNHTEIIFTPEQGLASIPRVIEILASYDITTIRASVGMYLLCQYISKHTEDKVIFSGEGSDELLQGYLYFHKAPSPHDGEEESLRLLSELHQYDVLRADRCISSCGLEPRVPFLDKHVVDTVMRIPAQEKCPRNGYEKYLLRKAFEVDISGSEPPYLPDEILWRRKEAFSDGVSGTKKSWYQIIQDYVETKIPDEIFDRSKYPSKEAMYYRLIFDRIFPGYDPKIPYWLPRWTNATDPSARTLTEYDNKEQEVTE